MKKNEPDVPFLRELRKLLLKMAFTIAFSAVTLAAALAGSYAYPDSPPSKLTEDQQQKTISGTVTDESGTTLPGVNVTVKGTTIGAITDMNGRFQLTLPKGAQALVFSFIGMTTQEVALGNDNSYNVVLKAETMKIDEVVIVGYGVQKKETSVGAVAQTSGEMIKQTAQGADLGNALTGNLPGLVTISTNGRPGGRDAIANSDGDYTGLYIRGVKTWNSAQPLVLVDGVERDMANVNPYEIDKISILKDASATAVFGVKGANGVILITTQRGKQGKAVMSFNAQSTAKTISRIPTRIRSYPVNVLRDWAIINELPTKEEAWNYIIPGKWLEYYRDKTYPYYLPDTDWMHEVTKDWAFDHNVNLSLTGGTKILKYMASIAYTQENDILNIKDIGQGYSPNFKYDRFNFRSNMDFDITSTTRFSANVSGYYSDTQGQYGNTMGFYGIYIDPPDLYPVKYADGTWSDYSTYSLCANPIRSFSLDALRHAKSTTINVDFILNQKLDFITKGLSAQGKIAFDNTMASVGPNISRGTQIAKYIKPEIVNEIRPGMSEEEIKALEAKYTVWQVPSGSSGFDFVTPPLNFGTESAGNVLRNSYYEFSINYARDFGKNSITALGLVSHNIRANGSEFPSFREDWVGRVTYAYDNRYLLEVNGAYNGSEKFAPKYRFGFFPSMAIGWTVSNEPFFKPIKNIMSNLKFRYSDGIIGSDAGIARWLYLSSWVVMTNVPSTNTTSDNVFRFGRNNLANNYPFRFEGTTANPEAHWEVSHKQDYGVETGFFKDQLKVNFDYFTEKRSNIFLAGASRVLPEYLGIPPVAANLGKVNTWGWEWEISYNHSFNKNLSIWASHSWTFAKSMVIDRGDPPLKPDYQKMAGFPINQPRSVLNQSLHSAMSTWNEVYGTVKGTSNTYVLPGDFAQLDYNADGLIDVNDQVAVGYSQVPQYTYAPAAGFTYKKYSGNIRFYGVYNVAGTVGTYRNPFQDQYDSVLPWDVTDTWSPERGTMASAIRPQLRYTTGASGGYVDYPRYYTKLQHAEIGYNITSQFLKKAGISGFRVVLSGDNLVLWSPMHEDMDADESNSIGGADRTYPKLRRYSIGINLNFQ